MEKLEKSNDLKIHFDTNITKKTLIIKNSYDGNLPQYFTLPMNAIEPYITICGGGGGGGSDNKVEGVPSTGGSAGDVIWKFPINNGDTIYYIIGKGGDGGYGNDNGSDGGITIVKGSTNFPIEGLQARGGKGGQGSYPDGEYDDSTSIFYKGEKGNDGMVRIEYYI